MKKAGTALGAGSHVRADSGTQLKLGKLVKSGGAGSVYLLPAEPERVAKIYHAGIDLALYERKIQAMLRLSPDLPDLTDGGARITQIAWPQALLRDDGRRFRGFTMPRLHLDETIELEYILQERQARAAGLPVGLGARVTLAANVSALVAELHRQRHYVVDLKPVNIRFYRQSLHLAMLDCDGFSIHGETERFPAPQYTPDYLAPEFHRHGLQAGGEEAQDRFALAVIVFQLLNFGIHPFTGRPVGNNVPTDIPGRIAGRYYAYGLRANKGMQPNPASGHEQLPQELRHLFDRAFGNTGQSRPAASEWARALAPYAVRSSGRLVVCVRNKEHQYFAGKQCAACAREALMARVATKAPKSSPGAAKTSPKNRRTPPVQPPTPAVPISPHKLHWWDWILLLLVFVIGGIVLLPKWLLKILDRLDRWLTNNSPKWRGAVSVTVLVGLIVSSVVFAVHLLQSWTASDNHGVPAGSAPQAEAAQAPPAPSAPGVPDPDMAAGRSRASITSEDIDALLDTASHGNGAEFDKQFDRLAKRPRLPDYGRLRQAFDALREYRMALRRLNQTRDTAEDIDQYLEKAVAAAPNYPDVLSEVGFARLMHFGNLTNHRPYEQVRSGWEATRENYYSAIAVEPDDYSHWHGLGMVCVAMENEASCAENAFAVGEYLKQRSDGAKAGQQEGGGGVDAKEFRYMRFRHAEFFFIEKRKTRLNNLKARGTTLAEKLKQTSNPSTGQTPPSQPVRG